MMGMDENERIESRMVASRIRDAQRRLARAATGNRPADSVDQWFEINLPSR